MSILSSLFSSPSSYTDVKPSQVADLPQGTRIIDVRQPEEFNGELGHLDGAELVPLATLGQAARTWDKAAPYLLVCRSGGRSSSACGVLSKMGFSNIKNLSGGMLAVRSGR